MPRTPAQNKAIRDAVKTKILESALRLFSINGFDDVTIDDIMTNTGRVHGLFYHYFHGKEDVFNELVRIKEQKYANLLIPRKEAMVAGGIKGLQILANYAERITSAPDEAAYFARISTIRHYTVTTYNEALLGEDPFPYLIKLVQQGQKDGDVRSGDPCEIANMFVDFASGAMYRRIWEGREKFCTVRAASIMRMFTK
ncbi:MAG: TetR/AcrR family transcriptional regulator [Bacilli bacterium]